MSNRFLGAYRLELILIFKHWGYWLVYGVWTAIVLSNFQHPVLTPARVLLLAGLGTGTTSVVSLIGLALGGISASRSHIIRFNVLEAAFPTGAEVVVGRFLAVFSALSAFLLIPLAVAVWVGPWKSFFAAMPVFIGETLVILAFVTGLVWVLQASFGVRRWMYPLFVLLWIVSALARNIFIDSGLQFPAANLLAFSFGNFAGYSEVFGRIYWGNLPFLFDLFYLGLVLLLLGVVIWAWQVKRFYRWSWVAATFTLIALLLTGISGGFYIREVIAANDQIRVSDRTVLDGMNEIQLPADLPYRFRNYDITIDMAVPDQPKFTVQLEIDNIGEQPIESVDYSLNEQFIINEPSERRDAFIHTILKESLLPGETTTLQMTYMGTLWWYEREYNYPPIVAAFTHPHGLNLPSDSLWYPVPGRVPLGWEGWTERGGVYQTMLPYLFPQSVQVRLHIINAGEFTYASNLNEIDEQTFVGEVIHIELIASPTLASARVNNSITLITAENEIQSLSSVVDTWVTPAWKTTQTFFPQLEKLSLMVIKERAEAYTFDTERPSTSHHVVLRKDPILLYRLAENDDPALQLLPEMINNPLYDLHPYLRQNIYNFLALYLLEEGDVERMRTRFTEELMKPRSFLYRFSVIYSEDRMIEDSEPFQLTELLITRYEGEGQRFIIDLFKQMVVDHKMLADFTPAALIQWVKTYVE